MKGYTLVVKPEDHEAQALLAQGNMEFVPKGVEIQNQVLCVSAQFYSPSRTDLNRFPVVLLDPKRGPEQIREQLEGLF